MKQLRDRIGRYKKLKGNIKDIELTEEELEEELLGVQAVPQGERTQGTNKFNSVVENQVEEYIKEKEKLEAKKRKLEREVKRIDNALMTLTEIERDIITTLIIEKLPARRLEIRYDRTYSRIKQMEKEALNSIREYFK